MLFLGFSVPDRDCMLCHQRLTTQFIKTAMQLKVLGFRCMCAFHKGVRLHR